MEEESLECKGSRPNIGNNLTIIKKKQFFITFSDDTRADQQLLN